MSVPQSVGLRAGQVFAGRYRIVRALREGGMGAVYEVTHEETEAPLALKVMLPNRQADDSLRERFRLEWKLTANVQGEHIVRAYDAGYDEATKTPFLVMELLHGEDLGTRVERDGPMPPAEVVALLGQLARALERIHAAGVVHRDIKPANLFVTTREDGAPLLKVLDFGVAKVVVETTSPIGATLIVGSPPYMPPEQLDGDGDIGTAADLYAFAQVAFTLLAGTPYWQDEHKKHGIGALRRLVKQGQRERATARARRRGVELPAAFDDWFAQATAVDIDERPASATAMAIGLARALGVRADGDGFAGRKHGSPLRAGLAALLLLPVLVLALLVFRALRSSAALPAVRPAASNETAAAPDGHTKPPPVVEPPANTEPPAASAAPETTSGALVAKKRVAAPLRAQGSAVSKSPSPPAPTPPAAPSSRRVDPFGDGAQ